MITLYMRRIASNIFRHDITTHKFEVEDYAAAKDLAELLGVLDPLEFRWWWIGNETNRPVYKRMTDAALRREKERA